MTRRAGSLAEWGRGVRKLFSVFGLLQTEWELKGDSWIKPPIFDRWKVPEDTALNNENASAEMNADSTATIRSSGRVNLFNFAFQHGQKS
mmetsp:Transcript_39796/g.83307  ORF Transcript_39796/g.83307 Transcript_39796/m.83307 type:complete len:90 (-) Transcript_39796:237-506(-)